MDGGREPPTPRALLYARVSTGQQAERYGLDAQRRMLRERATQQGYAVVPDGDTAVFADDESGGSLQRPAWQRLEARVEEGAADVVLTLDPDRLSRTVVDMLMVERHLRGQGVRLDFLTQAFEPNSLGYAFFQIRAVFAELERNTIRERTERGRREKARQGKIVLPQNLPVWLHSADQGATVQLVADWAPIVQRVYRLFLEGLTLYAIARQLDRDHTPPPGRGAHWQTSTLDAWLRHPAAHGVYHQLTWRAEVAARPQDPAHPRKNARRRRPVEEWAPPIPVPAIVTRAEWEAVQERRARHKAFARRNQRHFYLLAGLLRCARCGGAVTGHFVRGYRYYHCTRKTVVQPDRCDAPWVRAEWLEAAVWDAVAGLFRDPGRLEVELAQRQDAGSPTRDALEGERRHLHRRLAAIPQEQDRLLQAFAKGTIPEDAMARTMATLRQEREATQNRVIGLDRELAALQRMDWDQARVRAYVSQVGAGLEALDEEGRQRFLRDVVRDVRFEGRQVTVRTIIPTEAPGLGPNAGSGGPLRPHAVGRPRL